MPVITIQNEIQCKYNHTISIIDIANDISTNLNKSCISELINNTLINTCNLIKNNSKINFIINENKTGIEIVQHSCSNLLRYVIKQFCTNNKIIVNQINKFFYYIKSNFKLIKKITKIRKTNNKIC